MILCPGPSDKLQIVTDAAWSLHVHVSGMDVDGSGNVTTYRKNTLIAAATTTDISAVVASGVTRNIKTINIKNSDATNSITVTVRHTDGTTVIELYKLVLTAGQVLQYIEGVGWMPLQGQPSIANTELDYAQIINNTAAITATTEATAVTVITGNPVTYDGLTKVHVEFFASGTTPVGGPTYYVTLFRDGVALGRTKAVYYSTGPQQHPAYASFYDTPPAGSHTYSVGAYIGGGTSIMFLADVGGPSLQMPAYLRVSRAVGIQGPQGAVGPTGPSGTQTITLASQLPGTPTDGQLVFLDLGLEGPVPIMYDVASGHWVSPVYPALQFGNNQANAYANSTSGFNDFDAGAAATVYGLERWFQPFRSWDTAGFHFQLRMRGEVVTAANTNAQSRFSYFTAHNNAARGSYTQFTNIGGIGAGSSEYSFKYKDTGWLDLTPYPAVDDVIHFSAAFQSSGGIAGPKWANLFIDCRWVV